jgi:hypothetical protein
MIQSPTSISQLQQCVQMYLAQNPGDFIQADPDYCLESIIKHWKSKGYIRLLYSESKLIAFLLATESRSKHSPDKYLMQEYFCTDSRLSGFSVARAVKLLHQDLIEYAKKNRYKFVASSSSHLDEDFVFTKILEKFGWERRGYVAKYYL